MKYEDDNIILLVIEYLKYFHKLCDVNNIQINGMSLSPGTLDYDVVYTIKPPHPRVSSSVWGDKTNIFLSLISIYNFIICEHGEFR